MASKKGDWIREAVKNRGSLHKQLGIKQGKNIPDALIARAAKKKGKLGKRARLAQTLSKLRKK
jgi:hypothetical protein